MKKIVSCCLACCFLTHSFAQAPDTAAALAAKYFMEARLAAGKQRLWNKQLYGPILFVNPQSRQVWANETDGTGVLRAHNGIYQGTLPASVMIANTATAWAGKTWSVIQWPLPAASGERLSLITHELFHRIQRSLGLPPRDPTADHLASYEGRISLLLELQALKAALNEPMGKRGRDLSIALQIREKRRQAFSQTYGNERLLEMNEGLAEYTGVMTGRPKDSIQTYLNHLIDEAPSRPTLIRSMAYLTGPVYGYLLYARDPQWTKRIDSNAAFPALIRRYYTVKAVNISTAAAIDRYHAQDLIAAEKTREAQRQEQSDAYIRQYTQGPVLTIHLEKMQIGFNPSILFDLGAYGTVYPTAKVTDEWGALTVTKGMLMKDWKVISLPVKGTLDSAARDIQMDGWRLELNQEWKIVQTDDGHYELKH